MQNKTDREVKMELVALNVNGRTYNNVIGDDNVVNGKEIRRKK